MDATKFLRDKKRLSQALCSEENLERVVTDITSLFEKYNLDAMPEIAFDVAVHTLERMHLEKLKVSTFVL